MHAPYERFEIAPGSSQHDNKNGSEDYAALERSTGMSNRANR